MKVLIAGGCGFIGTNLSIYLKEKKIKVVSIDNLYRNGSKLNEKKLSKFKIKNYRIDIKNLNNHKIGKFDFIIDCCAEPSVEVSKFELDRVVNTNLIGTFNLLKKAIKDSSNFIFLSSSRVYSINSLRSLIKNLNIKKKLKHKTEINENYPTSSPKSLYGFTKLSSEDLIKELSFTFKFKYIINRFGVVSGPGQMGRVDQGFLSLWVWKHICKEKLSYIGFGGHGNQKRDVLHINDLNDIIYKQIKKIRSIYNVTFNIGGGKKNLISLKELTILCQKISGNKININSIRKTSVYDIPFYCSSIQKVYKHYKWKPKLSVKQIVKDVYNWQISDFKKLQKIIK